MRRRNAPDRGYAARCAGVAPGRFRYLRPGRLRGARRLGQVDLSPSIALRVLLSPPAATISTNGLNASGGQLSWVSQLVSVSVRTRSGLSAARIWQIPPPLSFPTRWT